MLIISNFSLHCHSCLSSTLLIPPEMVKKVGSHLPPSPLKILNQQNNILHDWFRNMAIRHIWILHRGVDTVSSFYSAPVLVLKTDWSGSSTCFIVCWYWFRFTFIFSPLVRFLVWGRIFANKIWDKLCSREYKLPLNVIDPQYTNVFLVKY